MAWFNYEDHIEIWVMKNYGFKESWAKLFSFLQLMVLNLPYDGWVKILGITKDDEVLMMVSGNKIVGYNLGKNFCRDITIESKKYYINGVATYLKFQEESIKG